MEVSQPQAAIMHLIGLACKGRLKIKIKLKIEFFQKGGGDTTVHSILFLVFENCFFSSKQ